MRGTSFSACRNTAGIESCVTASARERARVYSCGRVLTAVKVQIDTAAVAVTINSQQIHAHAAKAITNILKVTFVVNAILT